MKKNRFPNPLITKHLDGRRYELQEIFVYVLSFDPYLTVDVPVGFTTDLASIPSLFWPVIGAPNGRYGRAAVIHDYCYYKNLFPRKKCDLIFYQAMQELRVPFIKRWLMYHAVRTFAWAAWKRHRSKNKE